MPLPKDVIGEKTKFMINPLYFIPIFWTSLLLGGRGDAWRNELAPDVISYVVESFAGIVSFWDCSVVDGLRTI